MSNDDMKVEITNSFELGMNVFYGAGLALLLASLGTLAFEWIEGKVSSNANKSVYNISFTQNHETVSFLAADYERSKFTGQVIFYDCETGDRVILNTSVGVLKIAKVDPQVAQACHEPAK
jgi:hypothetical protein